VTRYLFSVGWILGRGMIVPRARAQIKKKFAAKRFINKTRVRVLYIICGEISNFWTTPKWRISYFYNGRIQIPGHKCTMVNGSRFCVHHGNIAAYPYIVRVIIILVEDNNGLVSIFVKRVSRFNRYPNAL